MIYFDKENLAVMKYIYKRRKHGARFGKLRKRFDDEIITPELFTLLCREDYTVIKDSDNHFVHISDLGKLIYTDELVIYPTPKANRMIEQECFDFWKWIIPMIISVAALVISALALA